MFRTRHRVMLLAAATLLACLPTQPCACPPASFLFLVYGRVLQASGDPAPLSVIAATATPDAACNWDAAEPVEVAPVRANQQGEVRSLIRSLSGSGSRCLRLSAYAGTPGASDSTVLPDLIVHFRIDRETPDSLGVVFRLP